MKKKIKSAVISIVVIAVLLLAILIGVKNGTCLLYTSAFYEGQIFYDSVSDIDRSMTENVKRYRMGMEQFKERCV